MDYAFALSRSFFSIKSKVDFAEIFDVIEKGNLRNAIISNGNYLCICWVTGHISNLCFDPGKTSSTVAESRSRFLTFDKTFVYFGLGSVYTHSGRGEYVISIARTVKRDFEVNKNIE